MAGRPLISSAYLRSGRVGGAFALIARLAAAGTALGLFLVLVRIIVKADGGRKRREGQAVAIIIVAIIIVRIAGAATDGGTLAAGLALLAGAFLLLRRIVFILIVIFVAILIVLMTIIAAATLLIIILLLFLAEAVFLQHAEIMIGELQIIFCLDAVAGKLGVAGHILIFFEQLRGIAPLAIVARIIIVALRTLATTTATAATLTIVDQVVSLKLAPHPMASAVPSLSAS